MLLINVVILVSIIQYLFHENFKKVPFIHLLQDGCIKTPPPPFVKTKPLNPGLKRPKIQSFKGFRGAYLLAILTITIICLTESSNNRGINNKT